MPERIVLVQIQNTGDTDLAARRWILDPIDGTTNLVYGYNMSSVSLGYMEDGQIRFGVVYNPYNGDTFIAERGKGATLNGDSPRKLPAQPPITRTGTFSPYSFMWIPAR